METLPPGFCVTLPLDATVAEVTCDSCGIVARWARQELYGGVMGAIFRCAHCDGVVMRLVRTPVGIWFDMRGSRRLFARSAP